MHIINISAFIVRSLDSPFFYSAPRYARYVSKIIIRTCMMAIINFSPSIKLARFSSSLLLLSLSFFHKKFISMPIFIFSTNIRSNTPPFASSSFPRPSLPYFLIKLNHRNLTRAYVRTYIDYKNVQLYVVLKRINSYYATCYENLLCCFAFNTVLAFCTPNFLLR